MTHTGQNKLSDVSLHKLTAFHIYADQSSPNRGETSFCRRQPFLRHLLEVGILRITRCTQIDNGQGVVEMLKSQSNVKGRTLKVHTP